MNIASDIPVAQPAAGGLLQDFFRQGGRAG